MHSFEYYHLTSSSTISSLRKFLNQEKVAKIFIQLKVTIAAEQRYVMFRFLFRVDISVLPRLEGKFLELDKNVLMLFKFSYFCEMNM